MRDVTHFKIRIATDLDALQSKLQSLSVEARQKLEKDTAKKEAKAEAKADAEAKKKKAAKVTIKRIERNKRKFVTSIHGLETFGIDLKKAAKLFAQTFATGSSVTKNPQGQEEIVVQGDVSDDILEIIEDAESGGGGQLAALLKSVPADNVVCIEEKKKKGTADVA
ncbi:Translation machinery-associated protein 22 [Tulasnella sp. 419]|nr:Translation machinery-associated protein 22 [Tulasnella sp. 418]KAG8968336.1 Translation machinery-associated protein 22 [Tulasnella sp. 419]